MVKLKDFDGTLHRILVDDMDSWEFTELGNDETSKSYKYLKAFIVGSKVYDESMNISHSLMGWFCITLFERSLLFKSWPNEKNPIFIIHD